MPRVECSRFQNRVQEIAAPPSWFWCFASNFKRPAPTVTPISYLNHTAVGVGQDEESPPEVARANFSRRKHARSDPVAQAFKVSGDIRESHVKVADNVFAEDPLGAELVDDPGDVRPKVPRIGLAEALARETKRLARIPGSEDIHAAAPRSAVEGAHIRPDRSIIQGLVRHPGHESGRSMCVPLDEANSPVSGFGDGEPQLQAARSCAEGKPRKGKGM